jgi:ATP-binding cassette, subfamily B (MDR/TAP), member 1
MAIFGIGGTWITKFSKLQVKEYGSASTIAEEIISSVRTAQAFGAQPRLAKLYDDNLVAAQRAGYKVQLTSTLMISVMFLSLYSFYGLGFCIFSPRVFFNLAGQGSRMLASHELSAGTVLIVLFAIIIGAFSLGGLAPRIEAFGKASAAAQKIFQTLQRIPTIDSLDPGGDKPDNIEGTIELKNVSFIYPARPEGISDGFICLI